MSRFFCAIPGGGSGWQRHCVLPPSVPCRAAIFEACRQTWSKKKVVAQRRRPAIIAIAGESPPKLGAIALLPFFWFKRASRSYGLAVASVCASAFWRAPCLSKERTSKKIFNWPLRDDFLLLSFFYEKKGPCLGRVLAGRGLGACSKETRSADQAEPPSN
ncbi:hypothetical protein TW95_gp0520 [Pandoravirus inopinatum]|uniref:Uncharacterized protein n=1 Tax=Pandoravirus inopinatum TaxID=1605721 RepID=A0A0B5J1A8_9VIRU|nr:hypothetical protein TW95_gp0520 [Pandoravirus inopinatum]AJF97254.1 hypothetical protein [Pandoravirus inopinatum]